MQKIYIYGFEDGSGTHSEIDFFVNEIEALDSAVEWLNQETYFYADAITPENLSRLSYDDMGILVDYVREHQDLCAKEIPDIVEELVALKEIDPEDIPDFYAALEDEPPTEE